jgi:hypothetical protein
MIVEPAETVLVVVTTSELAVVLSATFEPISVTPPLDAKDAVGASRAVRLVAKIMRMSRPRKGDFTFQPPSLMHAGIRNTTSDILREESGSRAPDE